VTCVHGRIREVSVKIVGPLVHVRALSTGRTSGVRRMVALAFVPKRSRSRYNGATMLPDALTG